MTPSVAHEGWAKSYNVSTFTVLLLRLCTEIPHMSNWGQLVSKGFPTFFSPKGLSSSVGPMMQTELEWSWSFHIQCTCKASFQHEFMYQVKEELSQQSFLWILCPPRVFSPHWIKLEWSVKEFQHSLPSEPFCPVWICQFSMRCDLWFEASSHSAHPYGFSPTWMLKCWVGPALLRKIFPY